MQYLYVSPLIKLMRNGSVNAALESFISYTVHVLRYITVSNRSSTMSIKVFCNACGHQVFNGIGSSELLKLGDALSCTICDTCFFDDSKILHIAEMFRDDKYSYVSKRTITEPVVIVRRPGSKQPNTVDNFLSRMEQFIQQYIHESVPPLSMYYLNSVDCSRIGVM